MGADDILRAKHMLAQGGLRLIALTSLAEQPRRLRDHHAVRGENGRLVQPKPRHRLYPMPTCLEEAGYVMASVEGDKKLYPSSQSGRSPLPIRRSFVHCRDRGVNVI
jgi:hypothetical protein